MWRNIEDPSSPLLDFLQLCSFSSGANSFSISQHWGVFFGCFSADSDSSLFLLVSWLRGGDLSCWFYLQKRWIQKRWDYTSNNWWCLNSNVNSWNEECFLLNICRNKHIQYLQNKLCILKNPTQFFCPEEEKTLLNTSDLFSFRIPVNGIIPSKRLWMVSSRNEQGYFPVVVVENRKI